jgi:hypothetical protein
LRVVFLGLVCFVCLLGAPVLAAERMTAEECEILQSSELEEAGPMVTGEVMVSRREAPPEAPAQLRAVAPRHVAVPRLCLGEEQTQPSCVSGPVDAAPDGPAHQRAHDPACLSSAPPLPPLAQGTVVAGAASQHPAFRPASRIERPPRA